VYAYPVNEAARIALKTAMDYLKEHSDIERVRFVLLGQAMFDIFAAELKKLIEVEILKSRVKSARTGANEGNC